MTQEPPRPPEVRTAPPRGRVLLLAPHQDDETLGCGGTLALHRDQDDPVRVLFLTDGAAGDPDGHYPPGEYVAIRQAEARRACALLGVTDLEFWSLPDSRLAEVADLAERVARVVRAHDPEVFYFPSAQELHRDHWAAGAAVEALRRAGQLACAAYAYEVWSALQPTHLVDIAPVLARKEAAMAQYPSQLRYHDYRAKIIGLNRYRSIGVTRELGHLEAFRLLA